LDGGEENNYEGAFVSDFGTGGLLGMLEGEPVSSSTGLASMERSRTHGGGIDYLDFELERFKLFCDTPLYVAVQPHKYFFQLEVALPTPP
jgi:hypothetical protein